MKNNQVEFIDAQTEDNEDIPSPEPSPEKEQKAKRRAILASIISWVKPLALGIAAGFFAVTFLLVNATVVSGSMENTIMTYDRIMGNRLAYLFSQPERFDIIAFHFTEYTGGEEIRRIYIKRIIALPGETVEIIDGQVFINGGYEPLPDDFAHPDICSATWDFIWEVPEDHFFVIGDNRSRSADSRNWADSQRFIPRADIIGKVIFRYHPSIAWLGNA